MSADIRLVLIILAVRDLPRAVTFYREAFGWPLIVDVPVYAEFALPNNQLLGLYKREGFGLNVGQLPIEVPEDQLASVEVYFSVDDLPTAMTRLEVAGARTLSPLTVRDWGDEAAYFADPDGNVLVVARPAGTDPNGQ